MSGERARVTVGAALCGFALCYALPVYARWPSLFYDPQGRRLALGVAPTSIAIGYYGQLLWGAAGAGAAALLAGLLLGRRRADAAPLGGMFAAWSLSALVGVAAWFAWNNWP